MKRSLVSARRTRMLVILQVLASVGTSHGQIYISDNFNSRVGAYTISGQPLNPALFSAPRPEGIVADGNFLYVAQGDGTIGKYTTSGAVVNSSLVSGLGWAWGMAISGTNLYVADLTKKRIACYTTSGETVNSSLISSLSGAFYLAINGNNLFVGNGTTIGEYTLDGAVVNASLISGTSTFRGMDISGGRLFVASDNGTIGEYQLDGTVVNASLITGLQTPSGIAVAGGHIFVSNIDKPTWTSRIGEYDLDGTAVNVALISGLSGTNLVVVVPEAEPGVLAALGISLWCGWRCRCTTSSKRSSRR